MTLELAHLPPVEAARRLAGLTAPAGGIPVHGLHLTPPGRLPVADRPDTAVPDGFDESLARFAADWRDPEPRAVATQFSKYWFRAAIPPVVICAAAGRTAPDVALSTVAVTTDGAGVPHLIARDDPGIAHAPADGEVLMDRLMRRNLEPIIAEFAARSGLAPRVFWSNAGTVIAWYLDRLREHCRMAEGARTLAAAWVEARRHPRFAGRNPMFRPLTETVDAAGHPAVRRRICCARYLSADLELCASCPLSKAPAARRANR